MHKQHWGSCGTVKWLPQNSHWSGPSTYFPHVVYGIRLTHKSNITYHSSVDFFIPSPRAPTPQESTPQESKCRIPFRIHFEYKWEQVYGGSKWLHSSLHTAVTSCVLLNDSILCFVQAAKEKRHRCRMTCFLHHETHACILSSIFLTSSVNVTWNPRDQLLSLSLFFWCGIMAAMCVSRSTI